VVEKNSIDDCFMEKQDHDIQQKRKGIPDLIALIELLFIFIP